MLYSFLISLIDQFSALNVFRYLTFRTGLSVMSSMIIVFLVGGPFIKFIDESYNANPLSMSSAIKNMDYYKRNNNAKKLVLLGDMLELGKKTKKFHKELSTLINKSDIDKVFVYGKYIRETYNYLFTNKKGKVFDNLKEAYSHFGKIIRNNDLLMVKGSNATGLNRFSKNIKRGQISAI